MEHFKVFSWAFEAVGVLVVVFFLLLFCCGFFGWFFLEGGGGGELFGVCLIISFNLTPIRPHFGTDWELPGQHCSPFCEQTSRNVQDRKPQFGQEKCL